MKVLIACEESQVVCTQFRERGHAAYSCDIIECSGGHPEWHIKGDVLEVLNPVNDMDRELGIEFNTCDGMHHFIPGRWDIIVGHPPCTYLSNAGASNPYQKWATDQYRHEWFNNRQSAFRFFLTIANAECDRIAIENPPGYINTHFRKPDQIIHPYEYGHSVNKPTCLWLKGLPLLKPTNIVDRGEIVTWGKKSPKKVSRWYKEYSRSGSETSKIRSKTFPGIARAMAEQWGTEVIAEY